MERSVLHEDLKRRTESEERLQQQMETLTTAHIHSERDSTAIITDLNSEVQRRQEKHTEELIEWKKYMKEEEVMLQVSRSKVSLVVLLTGLYPLGTPISRRSLSMWLAGAFALRQFLISVMVSRSLSECM